MNRFFVIASLFSTLTLSSLALSGCVAMVPFIQPDAQGIGRGPELPPTVKTEPQQIAKLKRAKKQDRIEVLISHLKYNDPVVRTHAAFWIGELGPKAVPAIPALTTALLNDDSRWVRRASAKALGKVRDTQAIPPLITALRDRDKWVAHSAANSLKTYASSPQAKKALSGYNGV